MEQLFTAQTLERGGLAAVALASVYLNFRLVLAFNKIVVNHIAHSTESNQKLTTAIDELVKFLHRKVKR